MSFEIDFKDEAKKDLKKFQKSGQKKLIEKIRSFTLECLEVPRKGTGHPEQLKYKDTEIWSRKINEQHRFVYEIIDNEETQKVLILSVWGHYDDK